MIQSEDLSDSDKLEAPSAVKSTTAKRPAGRKGPVMKAERQPSHVSVSHKQKSRDMSLKAERQPSQVPASHKQKSHEASLKAERQPSLVPTTHTQKSHEVSLTSTASISTLSVASDDATNMPKFIADEWTTAVLPTLYHLFFASYDPFQDFMMRSSSLVPHVQTVLDTVFPGHTYHVTRTSKVTETAYARINEWHSAFGSVALTIVTDFFKHKDYVGNTDAIAAYAAWALQSNGPGLFEKPTPQGCIEDENDADYQVCFLKF